MHVAARRKGSIEASLLEEVTDRLAAALEGWRVAWLPGFSASTVRRVLLGDCVFEA